FMVSKGMRVLGIDISMGQLELARTRTMREFPDLCGNYDFATGDVEQLPVREKSMDVVLYIATLHHLTNPEARLASMREIHRCLKPGGLCLVSAWAREQEKFAEELARGESEIEDGWEEGDMLLPWHLKDGDTVVGEIYLRYYHLFSGEEFDELMKSTGFEVLDRYVASNNHYAILQKHV
ncbi:MAG: class I SAM-dependent methyltransferase, partial [Thermoplasmata archaeon]|nr:class I SAM-dependent methyltransferase [Thermoplasmata archaeon]